MNEPTKEQRAIATIQELGRQLLSDYGLQKSHTVRSRVSVSIDGNGQGFVNACLTFEKDTKAQGHECV